MKDVLWTEGGQPVAVRRSQRALRMRLTVNADGVATVIVPRRATLRQARAFVQDQSAWLEKHVHRGQQDRARLLEESAPDDQGRPTRILLYGDWTAIRWGEDDRFRLPANGSLRHLEARLRELARQQAKVVIDGQVSRLPRIPKTLRIADQATRWGSLSGRGTLSLNWRLIMAPQAVFEYVVNHELAHLTHPNHSQAFWAEVERLMPDYQAHRQWLRRHGDRLRRLV